LKFHELKTDRDAFTASITGAKTFEIRVDDRDYKVKDLLLLRETMFSGEEMKNEGQHLKYTGRTLLLLVTDIMIGPKYGLKSGWVIMSVKPVKLVMAEPGEA
jgi:hypothetical protein